MISDLRKKLKERKGFTLIELLVVVAIIGILAAIAIPQYNKYKERAAKASAVSDAKNIANSIEAYYADIGTYPTTTELGGSGAKHTLGFPNGDSFTLSKKNYFVGYNTTFNTFYFSVSNATYNKVVTYDSGKGGVDPSVWK